MTEIDRTRQIFYTSLMQVAHREIGPVVGQLRQALTADPDFTSRACVALAEGGSKIRDTVDAAIVTLLTAPVEYADMREAGRVILLGRGVYPDAGPGSLEGLPPFRVFRVADFIRRDRGHTAPRLMKSVMGDYFAALETDPTRFDGAVLRNRRAMQNAYRHYHLKLSPRARAILSDDNPPADSKLAVLKRIAAETDPVAQARLVIEHRIPYVVAASILPKITPAVGVALVEVMSPAEALNSRKWVEEAGLLTIPEVKRVYLDKVAKASASAATLDYRKSAQGADGEVAQAVAKAKETAVAKATRIAGRLVLAVDVSGSMEQAKAVAAELAARIAPLSDGELHVIGFNEYARPVTTPAQKTLAEWQRTLSRLGSSGRTSPEAVVDYALYNHIEADAFVFITDGGENVGLVARGLHNYERAFGRAPRVVMIKVPGDRDTMSGRITDAGFRLETFETDGRDYYVYDQIMALLGGPPAKSLVERILETEMPRRGWRTV